MVTNKYLTTINIWLTLKLVTGLQAISEESGCSVHISAIFEL